MKARLLANEYPAGKYKKRKLTQLTTADITDIVYDYLVAFHSREEVARKHRVSPNLVTKMV